MGENNRVGPPAALTADDHYHDTADRGSNGMATPTPKGSTSPAFQFYPRDFLSSSKVQRMSLTERGVYITLLSYCWLDNGLPDDVAVLAQIVGMKQPQFARLWTSGPLNECFIARSGRLYNPRLNEERRKQDEFRRRQSDNGKRGGRPKKPTDNPSLSSTKAVAFSGLSETKPTKSSSSAICDLQSASAEKNVQHERLDRAFLAFQEAYPPNRRKGGFMAQQGFIDAVEKAGGVEAVMAALDNHKASEQWQSPNLIPSMDKWFAEERWRQRFDPPKTDEPAASKWEASLPEWAQKARARAREAKAVQS